MTKKLTAEEKIAKTLEYCKYSRDIAFDNGCNVCFQIEIENTNGRTATKVRWAGFRYTYCFETTAFLRYALNDSVKDARRESKYFNNLVSVRVLIKTYKQHILVDEEPVNDYEINFERGVEI